MQLKKPSAGFTLIELLVGSFLGILLLFGVLQIFNSSREGARIQTAMASVQDSGRIAIEFLSRDIRNADFSGCLLERGNLVNGINTTSTGYDGDVHSFYDIPNGPLHGYLAEANSPTADFGGHAPVVNSSVLTLVTARPFCQGVISVGVDQATADQVLTLADNCTIADGSPVLVASCEAGDIFIKTGGAGAVIEHAAATGSGLQNNIAAFSTEYGQDASVYEPVVFTYFLAPGQNGANALFRIENGQAFELVTNVESFDITFGIDSGSGSADVFINPTVLGSLDASAMASVVSVRVEVAIVSSELIDGQPLRRVYSATTNIRNRTSG